MISVASSHARPKNVIPAGSRLSRVYPIGTWIDGQPVVGTGPFQLVEGTAGGSTYVLEANPDYWGGAPHVDRVAFRVYKAEDPLLRRTVALKAMLPGLAASATSARRFLREAQAMAAVEHDHIVAPSDQCVNEVRADEPRPSGDQRPHR